VTRRLVLLVYMLHFLVTADSYALVPLVPTFTHRLGLSVVEAGLLVGAPALAMMLLSLPVGLGSERLGARPLAIGAAALLTVSALGQALAANYAVLVGSWLLFGVAYTVIYTAGPAWLAAVSPERRRSVLAGVATAAGLGVVAGPAFGGLVAEHLGVAAPFLLVAGCGALVTIGLLLEPAPGAVETPHTFARGVSLALSDRYSVVALGLMLFIGSVGGVANLLVPLAFHRSGLGSGAIGVAFTCASVLFVLTSIAVTRAGARLPALAAAGTAMVGLGAILALAATSQREDPLLAFLLLRAPTWSVLSTLSYPLCAIGAERAGIGVGLVLALGNALWGVGTFTGPLAGGAIAGAFGDTPVFAALALAGAATGVTVLTARRAYDPAPVKSSA
jgi:predicted MFS family arabinose efflux permease